MTSAWWASRSTSAATATASPKLSAQALKVMLLATIRERGSRHDLMRAKESDAASGSKGM
jgi:hypothetical protein